ncbi:uncharacterized protein LOC132218430 isoform X1 [Myotis daubentonii]|uniref:uncharacterized protein LOC132218430 isoform X1 n=1 Tax=Myotis daubentonii TaxID=98922 RepID=UPI002873058C|nr:uncharacterized protein LOC132218430 isoform X1 [Myotis daubentonii]
MTSINVRCWAPLRSALAALPLLLLLLALSNLHQPPPANVSRFKVRETYHQNSKQVTQQVGSQDCPLVACQTGIRVTVDIQSVYNGGRPYACFAYDQEDPDRSLLAAVPLTTSPRTQGKGECQPPVAGIPLWEPETPEPTLPPRICYQTSNPVIGGRITWNSSQNYIASSHTKASPGTFFWCNGTLSNCMNSSDPGPCFVVNSSPTNLVWRVGARLVAPSIPLPDPPGRLSSLPPCHVRGVYRYLHRPHAGAGRDTSGTVWSWLRTLMTSSSKPWSPLLLL